MDQRLTGVDTESRKRDSEHREPRPRCGFQATCNKRPSAHHPRPLIFSGHSIPGAQVKSISLSMRDERRFRTQHVQGYRQLTDVYLLGLAVEHDGCLATFDRGIPIASVTDAKSSHLRVILK